MKEGERRITITCYDDEGYDLVTSIPLSHFIETTEETGVCVCRFTDNKMAFIEKTKAGYIIRTWQDKERI
jgi:hypothetical protein